MKKISELTNKLIDKVNAGKWWAWLLFILLLPAYFVIAMIAFFVAPITEILKELKGKKKNEKPH